VVSRLEHLASDIGGKSHSERCCAVDEGEGVSWQVACRTDGVKNADHSGQQCGGATWRHARTERSGGTVREPTGRLAARTACSISGFNRHACGPVGVLGGGFQVGRAGQFQGETARRKVGEW
jgi:hypothetical protein